MPPHYRAPVREPAAGSRYDFLVRGLQILDQAAVLSVASGPIPLSADDLQNEFFRAWAERWNSNHNALKRLLVEKAKAKLAAAGVDASLLREPPNQDIHDVIEAMTVAPLQALDLVFTPNAKWGVFAGIRVIAAVRRLLGSDGGKSPTATAVYLMHHARPFGGRLNRDNVRRASLAYGSYLKRTRQSVTHAIATFRIDIIKVQALCRLYDNYRVHGAPTVSAEGAELAEALHARYDLRLVAQVAYTRIRVGTKPQTAAPRRAISRGLRAV